MGLSRCEPAVGDAVPPIPPRIAKNGKLTRNCLSPSNLQDQHRDHTGAPSGCHRQYTVGGRRTWKRQRRVGAAQVQQLQ